MVKKLEIPENREELAHKFRTLGNKLLKTHEKKSLDEFLKSLIPELINAVPVAAFDPIQPWDEGILFYHSDVHEEEVVEFQHDLLRVHMNLDPEQPILLNLSSFGGSVFAGLALISTIQELQRQGRRVNIHIQGSAMSMASVIAQSADYRTIEPGAFVMLHEISYRMTGSTADHEQEHTFTTKLQDRMYGFYSKRTGKSVDFYREKLRKSTWYMTAEEALNEGLVDEIVSPPAYKITPAVEVGNALKEGLATTTRRRRKSVKE